MKFVKINSKKGEKPIPVTIKSGKTKEGDLQIRYSIIETEEQATYIQYPDKK
ncbi:hypothetical protein [Halalkalibacter lacteus]|uniref:hypothetical protein n=1 Tax=Halalkalibacter lacteus TaxID=3090663 RepID=UPI002FCB6AD5